MKKRITILAFLLIVVNLVFGQKEDSCMSCGEPYSLPKPDTVVELIHDTTFVYVSDLEVITREFGMSFDEYVRTFLAFKDKKDSTNQFPTEKIYFNYFLPLLKTEQQSDYYRFVSREYTITPIGRKVNLQLIKHSQADSLEESAVQTDCMVTISGTDRTEVFLKSPAQIRSCLGQLFETVYQSEGKIKGVNFYFPDYTFKEKRAMAQFIKSASIVIDSCRIKPIRNLRLYASFNSNLTKENESFLDGIAQMTDSIFIFHYETAQNTLPQIAIIDNSDAQNLNQFSKIQNQFYLARYYIKSFPETSSAEFKIQDIYDLTEADYPDNQWEIFLYAVIGIVLLLLILISLYLTIPDVSYHVNKNIAYVYSILIMLFLEIVILVANIFEAMSKDNVFSLNNDSRYVVLLLPLLFIFIVPMMKTIGKEKSLP